MKEFFTKTALPYVLTAAMMSVALPAMAGANVPANDCAPEDKAKITRVEHPSLRVLDFTNSSQACLEEFGNKVSHKYLTLVAESNSKHWREATVEAARLLQEDGKRVVVAYSNDTDGLDYTADTKFWANGVERGSEPFKFDDGLSMDAIGAIRHAPAQKVIAALLAEGTSVWNAYLRTTPSLAMNN